MLDKLMSYLAPHHCYVCGESGRLLCDNCNYDIVSESFDSCVSCGKTLIAMHGICADCNVPYDRAWCVADRRDHLRRLIDSYKFVNTQAAYQPLARLLHDRLPELPEGTIIVPVPTVRSHIRQRGYDHMLLIARELSRLRGLSVETTLQRATSTKQRDASRKQRISQAKVAFVHPTPLGVGPYLLIDDVVTTGSTVKYAAKALRDAGAEMVWVATISRQTLD